MLNRFLISVLALAAVAVTALADPCTNPCTNSSSGADTADRTTFNNADLTLTFTNVDFSPYIGIYNTSAGLTDSVTGTIFVGSNGSVFDLRVENPVGSWAGAAALRKNNNCGQITATLPANTYAFGVDLLVASNTAVLPFDVSFSNGATVNDTTVASVALPGSVFFGVRSATPITGVTFTNEFSSVVLGLDNFEIGTRQSQTQADTPEAMTLVLIGSGLICLRFLRRHQQRKRSSPPPTAAPCAQSVRG